VLIVLEALALGGAGAAKFAGDTWVRMFQGWGYPAVFTHVVGAVEISGAALLLVPRATAYAAAGLILVMLGAVATLTTTSFETGLGVQAPLVHLAGLSVLLRTRWSDRGRPVPSV